jgi:ribosome maturation factor RimP
LSLKQLITRIIEEELVETNCFLVGIDANQAETSMKFYIDGEKGVDIQLCTRLSRKVSRILDEEYLDETPIRYEISSPGADQPLVDKRQYPQHIGRDLIVQCGDETLEGELVEVQDDNITINKTMSKNKTEKQTIQFEYIHKSTVKISFKRK